MPKHIDTNKMTTAPRFLNEEVARERIGKTQLECVIGKKRISAHHAWVFAQANKMCESASIGYDNAHGCSTTLPKG